MAKQATKEQIAAAKTALKEVNLEHKTNVKALQAAQKLRDKSAAKLDKAIALVDKLVPAKIVAVPFAE